VYVNSEVVLKCQSRTPVKWLKNDNKVLKKHIIFKNSLMIHKVVTEDSGLYSCLGTRINNEVEFRDNAKLLVGSKY